MTNVVQADRMLSMRMDKLTKAIAKENQNILNILVENDELKYSSPLMAVAAAIADHQGIVSDPWLHRLQIQMDIHNTYPIEDITSFEGMALKLSSSIASWGGPINIFNQFLEVRQLADDLHILPTQTVRQRMELIDATRERYIAASGERVWSYYIFWQLLWGYMVEHCHFNIIEDTLERFTADIENPKIPGVVRVDLDLTVSVRDDEHLNKLLAPKDDHDQHQTEGQ